MNFELPVPVLAEPYHIEDACKWLNRMTDGEARESTVVGDRNDRTTLAAGNSYFMSAWRNETHLPWMVVVEEARYRAGCRTHRAGQSCRAHPFTGASLAGAGSSTIDTLQFQRQFPFRHEPHP